MHMPRLFAACALFYCALAAGKGSPVERHALVIGNGAYASAPLSNPRNDAELMSATFKSLGFAVKRADDLGRDQLYKTVESFASSLPKGSIAMIYYAGHGVQIDGVNYLVPVDMTPTSEAAVATRAYKLGAMIESLDRSGSALNVVIVDACRNNPFIPQGPASHRSFGRLGLAPTRPAIGTLVAYSTAPGQLAEDGVGRKHSLYAEKLSAELLKPGQSVEQALKQTGAAVRQQSKEFQQPWFESSLTSDIYLTAAVLDKVVVPKPRAAASSSAAAGSTAWYANLKPKDWENIEAIVLKQFKELDSNNLGAFEFQAGQGNRIAQAVLGLSLVMRASAGAGGAQSSDVTRGLSLLQQASEAGFPIASTILADLHLEGIGVARNSGRAEALYRAASASGYERARQWLDKIDGGGRGFFTAAASGGVMQAAGGSPKPLFLEKERWERLRKGMSEKQVLEILGKPVDTTFSSPLLHWRYRAQQGNDLHMGRVVFKDQKVWMISTPSFPFE